MKKQILVLLTFLPLLVFAEGQYGLDTFLDTIDFIKIFGLWAILIWLTIKVVDYIRQKKLDRQKKTFIWVLTGIIALFIWLMIKHDPFPYEGPIDSLFKSKMKYETNKVPPDHRLCAIASRSYLLIITTRCNPAGAVRI